jgi:hypothetical protein
VLEPPTDAQQEIEDRLGGDLLGQLVPGRPALGEVAPDAGRDLAQRHAQIKQQLGAGVGRHGQSLAMQ